MRANHTPLHSSMSCCGLLPEFSRCQREETLLLMDSLERPSGRTAGSAGGKFTPSTIMSPALCPSTEIRLGVYYYYYYYYRAQEPITSHPRVLCERGPPEKNGSIFEYKPCTPRLTCRSFTDKENHDLDRCGDLRNHLGWRPPSGEESETFGCGVHRVHQFVLQPPLTAVNNERHLL
jgi:hypothetical protein